jgi:hypothetical protein
MLVKQKGIMDRYTRSANPQVRYTVANSRLTMLIQMDHLDIQPDMRYGSESGQGGVSPKAGPYVIPRGINKSTL